MSTSKAYPLHWPIGWPRTQFPQRSNFAARSVHAALEELSRQLGMLKATGMVISSNFTLGATPKDKGVCVYFTLKGKSYALPCDKWDCVEDNLWALAKHIESIRGQERWGVGTIERHFAGYTALPAPGESGTATWYAVLGVLETSTLEQAREAYLSEAKRCHPDNGGTNEAMQRLNAAWDMARKHFG